MMVDVDGESIINILRTWTIPQYINVIQYDSMKSWGCTIDLQGTAFSVSLSESFTANKRLLRLEFCYAILCWVWSWETPAQFSCWSSSLGGLQKSEPPNRPVMDDHLNIKTHGDLGILVDSSRFKKLHLVRARLNDLQGKSFSHVIFKRIQKDKTKNCLLEYCGSHTKNSWDLLMFTSRK